MAGPTMAGPEKKPATSVCTAQVQRSPGCSACQEEEMLHRKPADNGQTVKSAPPALHAVLRSPGQPLDSSSRSFFEARFGSDFSRVRVHHGAKAVVSAQSVNANAYTVGQNIVFGPGQYSTGTPTGMRLLAHELTHTLQQRSAVQPAPDNLKVSHPGDASEIEADRFAQHVMEGKPVDRPGDYGSQLAFQPASGSATPPSSSPPKAPAPKFVCGPDVTKQVEDVYKAIDTTWSGWSKKEQGESCWALLDFDCGPDAWDVVQLHNNAWIYQDYRPACASEKADPKCGSSVQVGKDCHYAGSVNYVIFGKMCKLCDIPRSVMKLAIAAHKVHLTGVDKDFTPAAAWADAGFSGWTPSSSPAGDRSNCNPSCPKPYAPSGHNSAPTFDFHWFPHHATEYVSKSCDASLKEHQKSAASGPVRVHDPSRLPIPMI